MLGLSFSGRRIRTPERGLLAIHPFVDVLEGRSLFTAAAHDGMMEVTGVVDVPAAGDADATNPWSSEYIDPTTAADAGGDGEADDAGGLDDLLLATTPGRIELDDLATGGSAFAGGAAIGDTDQTLFGNALWDRRGTGEPAELPTDAELAAARAAGGRDAATTGTAFRAGRGLTGAMRPYLTMTLDQANHPFAA